MLYAIASLLLLVGQVQAFITNGRYEADYWSGEYFTFRRQAGVTGPVAYAAEIAHRVDANGNCVDSGDYTVAKTLTYKPDWCNTGEYAGYVNGDYIHNINGHRKKDCINPVDGSITQPLPDNKYTCAIRLRLLYKETNTVVSEYWDRGTFTGNGNYKPPSRSETSSVCASPPSSLADLAPGVNCWSYDAAGGEYTGTSDDGTSYRLAAPCETPSPAPEPMNIGYIPLGTTVATNKLIVSTNGAPPPGYKAKDNGYPCLCRGHGHNVLSCGTWCGPNSPKGAGTDPAVLDEPAYVVQFWDGNTAGLNWEVDPDYDGYNPWA